VGISIADIGDDAIHAPAGYTGGFLSETSTYLNESRGLTAGQYVYRFGGQFDADTSTSASRGLLLSPSRRPGGGC
jgi:hypothetical protein